MRRSVLSSVAAACLALAGTQAFADTVDIVDYTFTPATTLAVTSPSYTGTAGEVNGLLNGVPFTAFCSDLLQDIAIGGHYTDYTLVDGVAAWGAAKSLALDQLFTLTSSASFPVDAATSAYEQALIWEILYETSGTWDLSTGTFVASSTDSTLEGYITNNGTAEGFAELASVVPTVHMNELYSPTHQDLIVAVPEPSTYALMFAGLAGIGFVARRRTQR